MKQTIERLRRSKSPRLLGRLGSWSLVALLVACSGARGAVEVTAYGEEFIEVGIPAEEVADGWSVTFSRFEVTLAEVTVGGAVLADTVVLDLTEGSKGKGHTLGALEVAVGDHEASSFIIERVEVDGAARHGDEEKSFAWVFDDDVSYSDCETTTSVTTDETATFQITVHADHLFYDSLVAEEPQLLFQPLADADADGDGEITRAELEAADIGAYDPGSAGGIDDLWAFLSAQIGTLGHVDGEGHCHATPSD